MKSTLEDLKDILENRKIVLARELTKIHEEFIRKNINELLNEIDNLKGEMILIIEGAPKAFEEENELNNLSLEEHYKYYEKQGLDKKEIIKKIAKDRLILVNNGSHLGYLYRDEFLNSLRNQIKLHNEIIANK